MKNKKAIIPALTLVALMMFTASCKRNSIEEPSPFGPSTFSVILNMSASPNVLFAGGNRELTTITASLERYDGMAIADKTIHFDIRDEFGTNITVGYFEGNLSTTTKVTDQNGMVSLNYFGPFAQELLSDVTVYITAIVAWEGEEFISDFAPVFIIRDASTMTFVISADPNTLLATDSRPTSQISAYLNTADGIPASGRKVFFWIDEVPGYFMSGGVFEGFKTLTSATTDENGFASVTYYGPTKYEIGGDGGVNIVGQPDISGLVNGPNDPDYLIAIVYIRILKDR